MLNQHQRRLLRIIKENTDNSVYIVFFNGLNKYLQLRVSMSTRRQCIELNQIKLVKNKFIFTTTCIVIDSIVSMIYSTYCIYINIVHIYLLVYYILSQLILLLVCIFNNIYL